LEVAEAKGAQLLAPISTYSVCSLR
jgi:hypothetical protein